MFSYLGSLRNLWMMQFPLKWSRWHLANRFCPPPWLRHSLPVSPSCSSMWDMFSSRPYFTYVHLVALATLLTVGQLFCPWTTFVATWAFDAICSSSGSSRVKSLNSRIPHPCYVPHATPASCACKSCLANCFSLPKFEWPSSSCNAISKKQLTFCRTWVLTAILLWFFWTKFMLNFKDFCTCVIEPFPASNTVSMTSFCDDFIFNFTILTAWRLLRREWLYCVTTVNSLWCTFLWKRWMTVICDNDDFGGERFMWKRCDPFNCQWNLASVTSRVLPTWKKEKHVLAEWDTNAFKRNKRISSLALSLMCFWLCFDFVCVSSAYHVRIYIYILIHICVFVLFVRLYPCTTLYAYMYYVPSLVCRTLGLMLEGSPPLLTFGWARVYK